MKRANLLTTVAVSAALIGSTMAWAGDPFAKRNNKKAGEPPAVVRHGGTGRADAVPDAGRKTLFCLSISTPRHVSEANDLKRQLLQSSGMKDWYVVHSDAASVIYYGNYQAIDASSPGDANRARADLAKVRAIVNARGEPLFRGAVFVETGTDDPAAPAEWNLLNLPADKQWTLIVADFVDIPNRKVAAVDAVREARKLGYEAYFYHGPTASSVCVGSWPRRAIKEQERDAAATYSPDQPILVSPEPLPDHVAPNDTRKIDWGAVYLGGRTRQRMKVMAPKVEVVDPSLQQTLQDPNLQHYALNGAETEDPPALTNLDEVRHTSAGPKPTGTSDLVTSGLLDSGTGGGTRNGGGTTGRLRGIGP